MAYQEDIALMAHLMRRAGFGATRDELEARVAKGYEATTLDEIAAAAGISRRTFFYYFKSKDDILLGHLAGYDDELRASVLGHAAAGSPISILISPRAPNSGHGAPILASSAITRASFVLVMMRERHAAPSAACSSTQYATPRQL